jgi:hypothetical protein
MDQSLAVLLAIGAVYLVTRGPDASVRPAAKLPPVLQTSAGSPTRYGVPGPAPAGSHWEPDTNQAAIERVVDPDGNAWALIPDGF